MKSDDLQQLIGAEITALGVLRHRRTSAEFLQRNKSDGCLEVSELLFLKPRRTKATFVANRWLGNLRNVVVHQLTENGALLRTYELEFEAGSWIVVAEGHALNIFQTIAQAPRS